MTKPPDRRHSPTSSATAGDVFETGLSTALQMWPNVPKNERDWAHFAARIEARIALTKRPKSLDSISDEQLLGSPLPEGEKESHKCAPSGGETGLASSVDRRAEAPHEPSRAPVSEPDGAEVSMGQSTYERERDRRGFKELAKLAGPASRPKAGSVSGVRRATNTGDASLEHDSGMVDLEALSSADPGAVDRASVTPLASTDLFGDEPVAKAAPSSPKAAPSSPKAAPSSRPSARPIVAPPTSSRPIVQAAPVSSPTASRPIVSAQATLAQATLRSSASSAAPHAARRSPLRIVGAVVGLAAMAAGAFFVVRTVRAPESAQNVVTASQHAVAEQAGAMIAQAPTPVPAANPGVDPLTLPKETAAMTATPSSGHHATHAWHGAHNTQSLVAKAESEGRRRRGPAGEGRGARRQGGTPSSAREQRAPELNPDGGREYAGPHRAGRRARGSRSRSGCSDPRRGERHRTASVAGAGHRSARLRAPRSARVPGR